MPPRPPKRDDRRPLLEALEPRILLSGDVDAALLGGALLENGDDSGTAAEVVLLEDGEEVAQFGSIVERRHEIVFVDSGLEDHGALVDALRSARPSDRELEVVLIDAERDGIAQITDVLSDHTDLDAVHIVSHGAEAAVQLGSSWLMADNLDAHTGSLLAWSDALSEDADLLFYGCNLAGGDEGAAFAESLAKLTGADVGASTDATGSALLGGDWNLELRLGEVESEIAIDAQLQQGWTGILDNAPPTHSVPGTQTTDVDTSLVFSDGAGNGIAIDDPDAGGNQVEVTLTATNGTLTLTGPGAVIDVNAETSWTQESPRVASSGAGNSVVVWASDRQDGDGWGIYAQLYDASGNPVGSEFRVNGTTAGDQLSPDVSMNANGEFVVVWQSTDGDGTGIFAQRYDASGTAIGGELLVNTEEQGDQTTPVVAMAADGSFAVAWQSQGQDGDASGIYAQRFDSAGAAQGAELRVNSETADDQTQPAIAMDADGDFVIVWQSQLQDGADGGIYGQRFDATGIAQGAEFRVNSEIANDQGAPDVAMDAAGNFVVAWESLNQDGSSWGIFAQRYDAAGTAQGAEFQVNTLTQNQQRAPSVSMDADGDFVVAWQGRPGSWDVFGQQFDAAGNPIGAEFQINQTSGGNQTAPDVAMDADGDFKAVWTGKTPVDNDGIAARDYLFTKGLSYTTGDGIGDSTIVMRGTQGDLNDALDGLTFTPTAGFSGLASVVITTDDLGNTGVGGHLSTNDTVYVIVGDVPNLAPILDASGDLRLSDVDEDAGDPSGDTVADILASAGGDPVFDIDPGALEGIAVVAVDASHGTWQFSIDGGGTWTDFGAVGDASAALLDSAAHVRFVPAPDYAGPAGLLTFRAWDQTTGSNGQTGVDTTAHGGFSAFSSETETATLDVRPVNDAPVLDTSGDPRLSDVDEDAADPAGDSVADILASGGGDPIFDIDPGALEGIAVVAVDASHGTWQFSIDGGGTWTDFGAVGDASAALLDSAAHVRFVPAPDYAGPAGLLTFRAWDQTTGSNGQTGVDTTAHGGSSAFSSETETATLDVRPLNDAPVLDTSGDPRLSDVDEDAADPAGDSVADILASGGGDPISDVDPGALEGIAVVAVDDFHGTWQFSIDGGGTWTDFGAVGDASAALLDSAAHVRFVPAPDYAGPAGLLTFRAWDQTTGSNGQTGVDTTAHGGSSAFSSETETATLDVRPVNDAPVNHLPGNQLVEEGGVLIFSQAGGNAIWVDDVEANVVRLTLEVSEGSLSLADISGLAFDTGDGTADATMTLRGSLSAVNAALDGLTYEAADDFSGLVTLRMHSDDLGGAGAGGPLDSESLLSISVTEVVFPDLDDDPEPEEDGEDPEDEADPEADGGGTETAPGALATPLTPIEPQPVKPGADRATPTLPRTEPHSNPDSSHADSVGPGAVELAATQNEQGFASHQRRTPEHRAQAPAEGALYQALDQLRDRMAREADLAETPGQSVFASVRAMALVVSTGVLTALLRGGSLLALTFSSLPLWNGFDPLAVLALTREERKKREEELREAQRAEDRGAAGLGDLLDAQAGAGADEGADSAPDPEHSDRGAAR